MIGDKTYIQRVAENKFLLVFVDETDRIFTCGVFGNVRDAEMAATFAINCTNILEQGGEPTALKFNPNNEQLINDLIDCYSGNLISYDDEPDCDEDTVSF